MSPEKCFQHGPDISTAVSRCAPRAEVFFYRVAELFGLSDLTSAHSRFEQVKFVMDENTTLADLLALHLHEFEDEVKNIVDKAVKEMSMEKVLKVSNPM